MTEKERDERYIEKEKQKRRIWTGEFGLIQHVSFYELVRMEPPYTETIYLTEPDARDIQWGEAGSFCFSALVG